MTTDRPTTTTATTATRRPDPTAAPTREPFAWLDERRHRRSRLQGVELMIKAGWLRGDDQADLRALLVAKLSALVLSGTLDARHLVRVGRCLVAMDQDDLRRPRGRPKRKLGV